MGIEDLLAKGRKLVDDSGQRIDHARHSEKAEKVRTNVVDGVEKFMTAILPGRRNKPRLEIGSAESADTQPEEQKDTAEEDSE